MVKNTERFSYTRFNIQNIDTEEDVKNFGETYKLVQKTLISNDVDKLPTATKLKNIPLVLSTKSTKGNVYNRVMHGERSTCFMFSKEFINKKLLEAKLFQQLD